MDSSFWRDIKPSELYDRVTEDENCCFVIETMRNLTFDPVWTTLIIESVASKRIETRCFVSWLARELQPKTYLEVGVRRGFSMAMVAARSPGVTIYGFDMWIHNYANVPNPGQEFVKSEMRRIGHEKEIHFINGNSHRTLPAFFGNRRLSFWDWIRFKRNRINKPQEFDLITIDGDHSLAGAYQDLSDVMPHCAVGGLVVFDDILPGALQKDENEVDPQGWKNLLGVWQAIQKKFPNFRYFEYLDNLPGVGIAVRLK